MLMGLQNSAFIPDSHVLSNTSIQTVEFIEIIAISKYNITLKFKHSLLVPMLRIKQNFL